MKKCQLPYVFPYTCNAAWGSKYQTVGIGIGIVMA